MLVLSLFDTEYQNNFKSQKKKINSFAVFASMKVLKKWDILKIKGEKNQHLQKFLTFLKLIENLSIAILGFSVQ